LIRRQAMRFIQRTFAAAGQIVCLAGQEAWLEGFAVQQPDDQAPGGRPFIGIIA